MNSIVSPDTWLHAYSRTRLNPLSQTSSEGSLPLCHGRMVDFKVVSENIGKTPHQNSSPISSTLVTLRFERG